MMTMKQHQHFHTLKSSTEAEVTFTFTKPRIPVDAAKVGDILGRVASGEPLVQIAKSYRMTVATIEYYIRTYGEGYGLVRKTIKSPWGHIGLHLPLLPQQIAWERSLSIRRAHAAGAPRKVLSQKCDISLQRICQILHDPKTTSIAPVQKWLSEKEDVKKLALQTLWSDSTTRILQRWANNDFTLDSTIRTSLS
jgi:hypothetical protein